MTDLFEDITIPTYVINLNERTDRLAHIINEFKDKPEFDLHIIEACKHDIAALGLWQTIVKIINEVDSSEDDVMILCKDDHAFTADYNKNYLIQNILEAAEQGVEILFGGIGRFGNAVPISENRYWIDAFSKTQFLVLYRALFKKIRDEKVDETIKVDHILTELTSNKMVMYPFISEEFDFGDPILPEIEDDPNSLAKNPYEVANSKMKIYHQTYKKYIKTQLY